MPEPVATIRVVPVDGGGFGLDLILRDLVQSLLAVVSTDGGTQDEYALVADNA